MSAKISKKLLAAMGQVALIYGFDIDIPSPPSSFLTRERGVTV
jgi:hypothetical protein